MTVFILVFILFTGFVSKANSETERHYFKDGGFSIEIPKGHELFGTAKGPISCITFRLVSQRNPYGAFTLVIQICYSPKSLPTLEEHFQQQLDLTRGMPENKEINTGKIRIDGIEAKWSSYYYKDTPMLEYMILKDNNIYQITCSTDKKELIFYKDTFDKIVQSIKFQ